MLNENAIGIAIQHRHGIGLVLLLLQWHLTRGQKIWVSVFCESRGVEMSFMRSIQHLKFKGYLSIAILLAALPAFAAMEKDGVVRENIAIPSNVSGYPAFAKAVCASVDQAKKPICQSIVIRRLAFFSMHDAQTPSAYLSKRCAFGVKSACQAATGKWASQSKKTEFLEAYEKGRQSNRQRVLKAIQESPLLFTQAVPSARAICKYRADHSVQCVSMIDLIAAYEVTEGQRIWADLSRAYDVAKIDPRKEVAVLCGYGTMTALPSSALAGSLAQGATPTAGAIGQIAKACDLITQAREGGGRKRIPSRRIWILRHDGYRRHWLFAFSEVCKRWIGSELC